MWPESDYKQIIDIFIIIFIPFHSFIQTGMHLAGLWPLGTGQDRGQGAGWGLAHGQAGSQGHGDHSIHFTRFWQAGGA